MIKFLLGFVTGVVVIWTIGLYQWFRMTTEEWNELFGKNGGTEIKRRLSEIPH